GAAAVDYASQIKPLLKQKCYACHGALKQKAGLRLDTVEFVRKGGKSGSALKLIVGRVSETDEHRRMPQEGAALSAEQIALLREWIAGGAAGMADERPEADPRQHWAMQPMRRAQVPPPQGGRNEIDAFVRETLDEHSLAPTTEASRAVLLRRVFIDLIGLPPSREELHAFLEDDSPLAYERVVDRLLNDPRHGERWARHWMDVWRYCDWHGSGNEIRYSQRHIWRWRDWIVQSLNSGKGYDRMVTEMLAGDEIAPGDASVVAATGFIGRNWYKFDRNVWMRELVEHTAVGFLGLTLKCARCHDHKFDPVSQEDYYRFRAFFEPHDVRTDLLSASTPLESFLDEKKPVYQDGLARAYDKVLDAPTYVFTRGDDRYPVKDHPMPPGVPAMLGGRLPSIKPVTLPVESYAPSLRPAMLAEMKALADKRVSDAEAEWSAAMHDARLAKRLEAARADRQSLQDRIAADLARHVDHADEQRAHELALTAARAERHAALVASELAVIDAEIEAESLKSKPAVDDQSKKALAAAEKKATDARKALDTARLAAQKNDAQYTPLGDVYPQTSSGRRLALAQWMTDAANPRTARVAVNHLWQHHFGRPLVDSVADFGLRAKEPSHPKLLDWLALDFVEHGWDMKRMHRLMVTSATYRQRSDDARTELAENPWLARMNSRRLEAETVRDSVLHIAGMMDETMGGREIAWDKDATVPRRSLYFQTAPNRQPVMLALFDQASTEECYERKPSVIPQQSLALMNSALTAEAARRVTARHVLLDDAAFVQAVFEDILTRPPSVPETERCISFLRAQPELLLQSKDGPLLPAAAVRPTVSDPARRAREGLVLVLFNHNDFVTLR
ncbi:MAG: PSD1 and planctomycete cytochrome C domain-containing protein, partial [Verrucomicrobiaceae bacterium]|nr:PSD1 and planctomycete cytochrome C domain-containing protein [Verrucomicrobiaceae bacterium]